MILYERGRQTWRIGLLLLICPVWCVGAALLAKALDCAVGGVAFGKCAAWAASLFGLDISKYHLVPKILDKLHSK